MELANPTPALRALPVAPDDQGNASGNANGHDTSSLDSAPKTRFYTISVSLRATYDSNLGTQDSADSQARFGLTFSPTIYAARTFSEDTLSASYNLSVTDYINSTNNGGTTTANQGSSYGQLQFGQTLSVSEIHTFSERLSLTLGDQGSYSVDPTIYENVGTPFNNGQHLGNLFSANLSYQLTPLIGLSASYSNAISMYDNQDVANQQNNIEQTASGNVSVSVLPKISVSAGGIIDDSVYETADRGYLNLTGFVGGQWQVNPDLSLTGRGGASYTVPDVGMELISPYAALSLAWNPRPRSHFGVDYSHEIQPSSQSGVQAATTDRLTSSFGYDFTSALHARFTASLNESSVPSGFATSQAAAISQDETLYEFSPGISYLLNKYVALDLSFELTGNISDVQGRNYNREDISFGVRGTY